MVHFSLHSFEFQVSLSFNNRWIQSGCEMLGYDSQQQTLYLQLLAVMKKTLPESLLGIQFLAVIWLPAPGRSMLGFQGLFMLQEVISVILNAATASAPEIGI